MKRFLIYLFSLLTSFTEHGLTRGFGIIAIPLSELMHVSRSMLMLLPMVLQVGKVCFGATTGVFIDKHPKIVFFIGWISAACGFILCSLAISNFYLMLFALFLVSAGFQFVGGGIASFILRMKGYGRTWDILCVQLARNLGPLLVGATVILFLASYGLSIVFIVQAIWFVVCSLVVYLLTRKESIEPHTRELGWLKELKERLKDRGYRRFIAISASTASGVILLGATFSFMFQEHGLPPNKSIPLFLFLMCVVGGCMRFFWAWLGHSISLRLTLIIGGSIWGIGSLLLPLNLNFGYVGLALISIGSACGSITIFPYASDRWGQENSFTIIGSTDSFASATNITVLLLSGVIYDVFGSYAYVFIPHGLLILGCVLYFALEKNIEYANPLNSKRSLK